MHRAPPLIERPDIDDNFLHLDQRVGDLEPPWRDLDNAEHRFPVTQTPRRGISMTFNVADYSHRLLTDFLLMGGRIVRAEFSSPKDIAGLSQSVVVNCSGYGARALFGDDSIVPVRGQIGWFVPQTDRLYAIYHRGTFVISRRDGVLVQSTQGGDFFGYGIDDETPNRDELTEALNRVAPMFDWS